MCDKDNLIMPCACKNKSTNNTQVTRVKQVVKTKNVTPTTATTSDEGHKTVKRVIYRRPI